jgi:hypothetical protein
LLSISASRRWSAEAAGFGQQVSITSFSVLTFAPARRQAEQRCHRFIQVASVADMPQV